jgi:hypothetical protein
MNIDLDSYLMDKKHFCGGDIFIDEIGEDIFLLCGKCFDSSDVITSSKNEMTIIESFLRGW